MPGATTPAQPGLGQPERLVTRNAVAMVWLTGAELALHLLAQSKQRGKPVKARKGGSVGRQRERSAPFISIFSVFAALSAQLA